jgi:hypothetical protein
VYGDLLDQARALTKRDKTKPKQVNLRRAVSSAYYALFHFLVEESCRTILGTQNDSRAYRDVLARAFDHSSMKQACASFEGGTLPTSVLKGLPSPFLIEADLQQVAATFVEAQEKRHLADYDRSERFARKDVEGFVEQVQSAMDKYAVLSDANVRRFFLTCLLTWKTLSRR